MVNITELTCRVCLEERDVLINIYDELEEINTNLEILLETCAGLVINSSDIFPKYLCEDCTRELLITSKFLKKCDRSKEILKELSGNSKVRENKELSNSSDLIESCIEDRNTIEVEDLKIQDSDTNEKNSRELIDKIETVEQDSSKEGILEPIKDTNLPNQHENVIEEVSSYEEYSHQFVNHSNQERPTESVNVSWGRTTLRVITKSLRTRSKKTHSFKCDMCGAIFKQAINLQKHFQKAHDIINCFTCSKCGHFFSLESEFCKHAEDCTYLKTNPEAAENKTLDGEKAIVTTTEPEHNRKCMYCEREFSSSFSLRMHLRTHTGERPFQCEYCTKAFKAQSHLNVHHKRHIGQADFICKICNKAFYEQSNLVVHMRSHTGERPHVCTICKKTFTRVFLLQIHMRIHTGEKPFKCNYCDKSFRQNTDLRRHQSQHTIELSTTANNIQNDE